MVKEQKVFILFGEALETNVEELNALLDAGWSVTQMCGMPSTITTGGSVKGTRFYEPQCAVVLEREISDETNAD